MYSKILFSAGLGTAFLTSCSDKPASENLTKTKPNIIYILADDLGYGDLSCYGQEKFTTPNLDRLASEGMRFTQHYSGSTVSAPSRSVLMTGKHTGKTRVRGNYSHTGNERVCLEPGDTTIAELLKQAGYITGAAGKWGLGESGTEGIPNKKGFDHWMGFLNQRNAHFHYPPFIWKNQDSLMLEGNRDGKREDYVHDYFMSFAMDFIRQHKDTSFFLYLPVTIPHAELLVPEEDLKAFDGKYPETPFEYNGHYNAQAKPHAAFAAMVTKMDAGVGQILELLQQLGIDSNTIIMFSSDNGPHLEAGADPDFFNSNGPLRGYKRDLYEGGVRVPFIVRWPAKVKAGVVSEHVSAFQDVLPTLAEIAGIDVPVNIDGISMLPEITGSHDQQLQHDVLYWEFHEKGSTQALVWQEWKLVYFYSQDKVELFNLKKDIGETTNVADANPEIVEKMKQFLVSERIQSEHWPLVK